MFMIISIYLRFEIVFVVIIKVTTTTNSFEQPKMFFQVFICRTKSRFIK